ncbi:MAG: hypothetical protein Q7T61_06240 [Caulobacter sp.]|nr:hypothetical protein [Caulobacter sp.]
MRATPILKTTVSLAAIAFAAAIGGSALAQSQPSDDQSMPSSEEEMMQDDAAVDAAGPSTYASDIAADAARPAAIPVGSPTPVEQAHLLKAGDPSVVSNAPVADTPATRRAYGGPDSNGGKQTRPVGN